MGDDTFIPHFQSKTLRPPDYKWLPGGLQALSSACQDDGGVSRKQLSEPSISFREQWHERTLPVTTSRVVLPASELNGSHHSEQKRKKKKMSDKLLHKTKSSSAKHSNPPKSFSKSLPSKRTPLEEGDQARRKKSKEEQDLCQKNQDGLPQGLPAPPAIGGHLDAEKVRMKKEIERYTSIMTTEGGSDPKQPQAPAEKREKKKHRRNKSPSGDGDKEVKLREKIQQLLRSQWESRLQLVDVKSDPVPPPPPPPPPLPERYDERIDFKLLFLGN